MSAALPKRPRLARRARVRWDEREGKHLLVYPERGLLLNAVAARIVALVDGNRTVPELVAALLADFPDAPGARVEGETRAFLQSLADRGLLAEGDV